MQAPFIPPTPNAAIYGVPVGQTREQQKELKEYRAKQKAAASAASKEDEQVSRGGQVTHAEEARHAAVDKEHMGNKVDIDI